MSCEAGTACRHACTCCGPLACKHGPGRVAHAVRSSHAEPCRVAGPARQRTLAGRLEGGGGHQAHFGAALQVHALEVGAGEDEGGVGAQHHQQGLQGLRGGVGHSRVPHRLARHGLGAGAAAAQVVRHGGCACGGGGEGRGRGRSEGQWPGRQQRCRPAAGRQGQAGKGRRARAGRQGQARRGKQAARRQAPGWRRSLSKRRSRAAAAAMHSFQLLKR